MNISTTNQMTKNMTNIAVKITIPNGGIIPIKYIAYHIENKLRPLNRLGVGFQKISQLSRISIKNLK